jgi:hypothetical protein
VRDLHIISNLSSYLPFSLGHGGWVWSGPLDSGVIPTVMNRIERDREERIGLKRS